MTYLRGVGLECTGHQPLPAPGARGRRGPSRIPEPMAGRIPPVTRRWLGSPNSSGESRSRQPLSPRRRLPGRRLLPAADVFVQRREGLAPSRVRSPDPGWQAVPARRAEDQDPARHRAAGVPFRGGTRRAPVMARHAMQIRHDRSVARGHSGRGRFTCS